LQDMGFEFVSCVLDT